MSDEWMIDVLRDLRKFAFQNGLLALAEQLDDTIHVAVSEVQQRPLGPTGDTRHATGIGRPVRSHATGTGH